MDSKEDLLYRIVDDVHEEVQARMDVACAPDKPALERLLTFVEEQVHYNAKHVTRIAVYHHEWLRLEADRLKDVRQRRRQQELTVIRLLGEAKEDGDIDPELDTKPGGSQRLRSDDLAIHVVPPRNGGSFEAGGLLCVLRPERNPRRALRAPRLKRSPSSSRMMAAPGPSSVLRRCDARPLTMTGRPPSLPKRARLLWRSRRRWPRR